MTRRTARTSVRAASASAVVLAAGLLTACSASSSGGSSPTSSVPPSTTTSTVTATATAASTPPPTVTTSATDTHTASGGSGGSGTDASAYCKESQLQASIESTPVEGSGEHGRKAVIVDFLNKSGSTCVLYGYPGAAVLDPSGKQVQEAKRTVRGALLGYSPGNNTLVHVRLKPGHVAKAGIEGTDQQEQGAAQAGCEAAPDPRIEVTPPNTSIAVPFTVTWPVCYSITVHPVNYN